MPEFPKLPDACMYCNHVRSYFVRGSPRATWECKHPDAPIGITIKPDDCCDKFTVNQYDPFADTEAE